MQLEAILSSPITHKFINFQFKKLFFFPEMEQKRPAVGVQKYVQGKLNFSIQFFPLGSTLKVGTIYLRNGEISSLVGSSEYSSDGEAYYKTLMLR